MQIGQNPSGGGHLYKFNPVLYKISEQDFKTALVQLPLLYILCSYQYMDPGFSLSAYLNISLAQTPTGLSVILQRSST